MSAVYGCHNHAPFKPYMESQDGWDVVQLPGETVPRVVPRMVRIPFRMSMDCHYDLHHTDPKCKNCSHVAPPQQMEFSFDV